jgi:hypothetical protein
VAWHAPWPVTSPRKRPDRTRAERCGGTRRAAATARRGTRIRPFGDPPAGARGGSRGDEGTNDLLVSGLVRRNELQSWFVLRHLEVHEARAT